MTQRWSIEVRGETPQDVVTHVFSRLPIAIGRHASNDLRLDRRFVSSFHARLDETAGRLSVVDLGSTNGVHVRCSRGSGKTRIVSHEPHDLTSSEGEFCVGAYSLRLFRSDLAGATGLPLGSACLGLPSLPLPPAAGAAWAPAAGDSEGHRAPAARVRREPSPARSRRAREAIALAGLEQLASTFSPGRALETAGDVEQLIRHLHAAVEHSCRGLVRLRRGQRRCAAALDLPQPAPAADVGWGTVEDPTELARLLLDGRRPAEDAAAALTAQFHALACHQVALLEGVLEGAGALLGELAPERIESELSGAGSAGAWSFGREFKLRWRAYRERHRQLSRRDGALSLVFGRVFREAYAAYLRGAPRAREASARRAGKLRQGLLPERRL